MLGRRCSELHLSLLIMPALRASRVDRTFCAERESSAEIGVVKFYGASRSELESLPLADIYLFC